MLDVKYNYPHTFLISISVITLIFGFYPFYSNNFYLPSMNLTQILLHFSSLILSLVFFRIGFSQWKERENERNNFLSIKKQIVEQELALKKLDLQEREILMKKSALLDNIKMLEDRKEKETKKTKGEIEDAKRELEKINKTIIEKQSKFKEEINKLYDLQKEGIKVIPNYYMTNYSQPNLSGSILVGSPIISSTSDIYSICLRCGKGYTKSIADYTTRYCTNCKGMI